MTVGERIAARRKELNMTQEELAAKLGYKSRSSINKIELSSSKVPLSKLEKVAAALDCSAAYLMGWETDDIKALAEETVRHNELNTLYDRLSPNYQSIALNVVKALLQQQEDLGDRGGSD